jgi:condensin complex subunit 2
VPLNDDRQEKAARRHAQQQAQRDSMRASTTTATATATPGRRRVSLAAGHDSPHTPSPDQDDMPDITGTAVTPGSRVMPLLANFEEWMKMATDNVSIHGCT